MNLLDTILSLVFPRSCIGCKKGGTALCQTCLARIPFAPSPSNNQMYAIYDFGHPLVARAIHDLKYYRKSEAVQILIEHGAPLINEWLADLLQSPQPHQMVLVPIPLHPARLKERGFNQSALLARRIAKTIPNTKTIPLLKKYRLTIPQARIKHRPERITNLSRSMKAVRTINSTLLYILVDDVMTTGATFQEATRALKEAGAQRILSLALAHGHSRKK